MIRNLLDSKKIGKCSLAFLAVLALASSGCSTANVSFVPYPMVSYSKIPLPEGAGVKIVARKGAGPRAESLAEKLRQGVSKASTLRVTKGKEPADYWFIVDSVSGSRCDSPEETAFNDSVYKKAVGGEYGGQETLATGTVSTSETSRHVAISVYDAKTLTPVHYFEIPIYAGARLPVDADEADHAQKAEKADAIFVDLAVEHITGLFVAQQKNVKIPIPNEVDPELKELFEELSAAVLMDEPEKIETCRKAFQAQAAALLPATLDTFRTDYPMESGDEIQAAEQILGGCYLRALVEELECSDASGLKALHGVQFKILELCSGPSLQNCCATALARIEHTLSGMGGK